MEVRGHVLDSTGRNIKTRTKKAKRYIITLWAALECLFFGGLVIGWGSLVFVLKEEEVYSDLCTREPPENGTFYSSHNTTALNVTGEERRGCSSINNTGLNAAGEECRGCSSQDERFNLVFTVAAVSASLSSPVMGHIQYKIGTRGTRLITIILFASGSVMIAFTSSTRPWLIFPGLSLVAIGGIPILVTNIQVAYLYGGAGSTIVNLLTGCFDVSSSVQLLIKVIHENGIAMKYSYLVLTGLFVAMSGISTFLFMPKMFVIPVDTPTTAEIDSDPPTSVNNGGKSQDDQSKKVETISLPSMKSCMLSGVFLSHVTWFCILELRFWYFIGSLNPWLNVIAKGDKDSVSHYTNVSLYSQLAGVVTSLCCGFFLDIERRKNKAGPTATHRRLAPSVLPQACACVLSVLLSALVLIRATEALYVAFVIVIIFRSFIYGLAAAYVQMIFPAQYFGFLYGVLISIGGIFGCLQYPLFIWSEEAGYTKVNIFLLLLTVTSFAHPLHLWAVCRKAGKNSYEMNIPTDSKDNSEYEFIKRPFCHKLRCICL